MRGSEAQAAELNAFTIAQAEKQWLYQPGPAPPAAVGLLPPLAGALFPGYGRIWAEMSAVRKEVTTRLEAMAGELTNELTIVSVA